MRGSIKACEHGGTRSSSPSTVNVRRAPESSCTLLFRDLIAANHRGQTLLRAASFVFVSLHSLTLFPLCVIPTFLFFKRHRFFRQTSILVGESAEQSARGLKPHNTVLNKVVHSAVKPLGWAAPQRTWERMAD